MSEIRKGGLGFSGAGLGLPFLPDEEQLANQPDFKTAPLPPRQQASLQGAQTEVRNAEAGLAAAGVPVPGPGEDPNAMINLPFQGGSIGTGGTFLEGAFDVLQAGNFAAAGFWQELNRTNRLDDAMWQAGTEFVNALPGIELEAARRPTYSDYLKETDFFGAPEQSRWLTPTLGFLLDLFADPLTYTGFGAVKAGKALRGSDSVFGLINTMNRAGIKSAGTAGELFLPHFRLRQFGVNAEQLTKSEGFSGLDDTMQEALTAGKGGIEKTLHLRKTMLAARDNGLVEIEAAVKALRVGLSQDEARIITVLIDQKDDKFMAGVRAHMLEQGLDGVEAAGRAEEILGKAQAFRKKWAEWGDKDLEEGLLTKLMPGFFPARAPQTAQSMRVWRDFMDRRLGFQNPKEASLSPGFNATPLEATATYQRAKVYKTMQQRLASGEPTELDIGLSTARLGIEHVRQNTSRRFVNAVIADTNLVRHIGKGEGAELLADKKLMNKWRDLGYEPVNLDDLQFKLDDLDVDSLGNPVIPSTNMEKANNILATGDLHMMPTVMADHLRKANKFYTSPDEAGKFGEGLRKMQGLWKGYALLSPGYHLRNTYSNWFNNWLAGVVDPRRYAQMMTIQAGGTENLPIVVREGVELLLGGRKTMEDNLITMKDGTRLSGADLKSQMESTGVMSSGVFSKDMLVDAEGTIMTNVQREMKAAGLHGLSKAAINLGHMIKGARDSGSLNITDSQIDSTVRVADARAKTWATLNGSTTDEWFSRKINKVRSDRTAGDFGDDKYFQRGPRGKETYVTSPSPDSPDYDHGFIEMEMFKVYSKYANPTADQLRHIPGAPTSKGQKIVADAAPDFGESSSYPAGPIDHKWLVDTIREWTGKNQGKQYWYRDYGRDQAPKMGDSNMPEWSSLNAILSPETNAEDNLAMTYFIMRKARAALRSDGTFDEAVFRKSIPARIGGQDVPDSLERMSVVTADGLKNTGTKINGDQVKKMVNLYTTGTFSGDMKSTTFAMDLGNSYKMSGFFPFTVNDVHIARVFGYGKKGKAPGFAPNGDEYRYAQYMMVRAAKDMDPPMSPDEVQAALWFYSKENLVPKTGQYKHLGGEDGWKEFSNGASAGSIESANLYSSMEYRKLLDEGFDSEISPFQALASSRVAFDRHNFVLSQDWLDGVDRTIDASTKTLQNIAGREVSLADAKVFNTAFMKRVLTHDKKKFKWLAEIEKDLGFDHTVHYDNTGGVGGIEPSFSLHLKGINDEDVIRSIASLVGDGMARKNVTWGQPRRFNSRAEAHSFAIDNPHLSVTDGVQLNNITGRTFSEAQANRISVSLGLDLQVLPGRAEIRLLNPSGAEGHFNKITPEWLKDNGLTGGMFAHVGGQIGEDSYGEAISSIRLALARTGRDPADLARRVYRDFHGPYLNTYKKTLAEKYGKLPGGYQARIAQQSSRGIARGLESTGSIANKQNAGQLDTLFQGGSAFDELKNLKELSPEAAELGIKAANKILNDMDKLGIGLDSAADRGADDLGVQLAKTKLQQDEIQIASDAFDVVFNLGRVSRVTKEVDDAVAMGAQHASKALKNPDDLDDPIASMAEDLYETATDLGWGEPQIESALREFRKLTEGSSGIKEVVEESVKLTVKKTKKGGISFGDRAAQSKQSGTYTVFGGTYGNMPVGKIINESEGGYMDAAQWKIVRLDADGLDANGMVKHREVGISYPSSFAEAKKWVANNPQKFNTAPAPKVDDVRSTPKRGKHAKAGSKSTYEGNFVRQASEEKIGLRDDVLDAEKARLNRQIDDAVDDLRGTDQGRPRIPKPQQPRTTPAPYVKGAPLNPRKGKSDAAQAEVELESMVGIKDGTGSDPSTTFITSTGKRLNGASLGEFDVWGTVERSNVVRAIEWGKMSGPDAMGKIVDDLDDTMTDMISFTMSHSPTVQQVQEIGDIARKSGRSQIDVSIGGVRDTFTSKQLQSWVTDRLSQTGNNGAKGAVTFAEDGKAVIDLFENADFSTIIHELSHIFRRDIGDDALGVAEKWAGVKDGVWTREAEEKFAVAFENYMQSGKAPVASLNDVFARAREWLTTIYSLVKGSPIKANISDDIRDVFDGMLGKDVLNVNAPSDMVSAAVLAKPSSKGASDNINKLQEVAAKYVGINNPLMQWNRAMGSRMESNARGAHYLDKLENIDTKVADPNSSKAFVPETMDEFMHRAKMQSSQSVDQYLFDYGDGLTDFENKWGRALIPFYSWMRFNMPLQFQSMVTDPGRYSKIPKFLGAVEDVTSEWHDIPENDYFKEISAVRMPLIMNSKPVFLNPNLPFQDLNRMNSDDILSSMSPFLKAPFENAPQRGYSFFLDRPIEGYPGEPSDILPGFSKKQENLATTLVPPLSKVTRAITKYGEGELSAQLISELLGIKLINVDPGRTLRSQTYGRRELLRALKKQAENEGIIVPKTSRRRKRRRRRSGGGSNRSGLGANRSGLS